MHAALVRASTCAHAHAGQFACATQLAHMLSHARMPDWPGSPVPPSAGPPTAKIGEPWAKEYIIVLHWIGKKKIVNPNNVQESDQGQT